MFTLFTASDIRNTRELCRENLELLITTLATKLLAIYHHDQFPDPAHASATELLNCLRILTRILPYVYEKQGDMPQFDEWIDHLFWSVPDAPAADAASTGYVRTKPLAEELIDTGMGLLFAEGFTVPLTKAPRDKRNLSIWETGVGCTTPITSSHELESNKVEVLRFLLTLCSDCLYISPAALPLQGSRFLTYMVTMVDRRTAMATLCSLLNTILKYSPGWKVPYDHMIISDRHRQLITYSLQYLLVLLIYPIPETVIASSADKEKAPPKNIFRHLCGKIHKTEDLQFIGNSLAKMLSQPIHASLSYLPGSRQEISWIPELTMLFWDLIQCNKKFRAYLIASDCMQDYMTILLYYIHEKRLDPTKIGLVRLCSYVLLYLTTERSFAISLAKPFSNQTTIPHNIQPASFSGSYSDYLITQLYKIITTSNKALSFLVPTFLDCIYNISPFIRNLSYSAASNIVQLTATLSNPAFLFAKEFNHHLLISLLKSINLIIECNFHANRNLIFLIMKNESIFLKIQALRTEEDLDQIISSTSGNPDLKVPARSSSSELPLDSADQFVIGDSDDEDIHEADSEKDNSIEARESTKFPELAPLTTKARNKGKEMRMPLRSSSTSPQLHGGKFAASSSWTLTWLPLLPTHTVCSMITYLRATIPYFQNNVDGSGSGPRPSLESRLAEPSKVIDQLASVSKIDGVIFYNYTPRVPENPMGEVPTQNLPADYEVVRFPWTRGSLGWYESILWGSIFQSERQIAPTDTSNMVNSSGSPVGVWNNTAIKLFRLQETAPRGPSLLSPKGAVDAMAETVMQKIGQLRTK